MRRLKMVGLAIVAVFALAAVVASAASAALPEFTVESKSTGTSGTGKLNLTGAAITCEKGTTTSAPTSKKLGTGTITFTGCKLKGEECHSLADAAGTILVGTEGATPGEYHVVNNGTTILIWFLIPPVHIECKFEALLVVVQGNVLGSITPTKTKTTKFEIKVSVVAGKQEITEFENNASEKVKAKLEGAINGGAFKAATEESAENKTTTELETEVK